MSCACAAVCTVIARMTDKPIAEDVIRNISQRYPGGFRPDPTDVVDNLQHQPYVAQLNDRIRDPNLRGPGTQMSNIAAVLNSVRLRSKRTGYFFQPFQAEYKTVPNVRNFFKKTKLKRPVIARVYWGQNQSSGHFVVVDGHKSRMGRNRDLFCVSDSLAGPGAYANQNQNGHSNAQGGVNCLRITQENGGHATYRPEPRIDGHFDGQVVEIKKVWIRDRNEEQRRANERNRRRRAMYM